MGCSTPLALTHAVPEDKAMCVRPPERQQPKAAEEESCSSAEMSEQQEGVEMSEEAMSQRRLGYCGPITEAWEALQAHRCSCLIGPPSTQELAQSLADLLVPQGASVTVRTSKGHSNAASFARAAHSFILLEHEGCPPLIVDPLFQSQFYLGRNDKIYANFLATTVPQVFVGTARELETLVCACATAMAAAFAREGMPHPPWRQSSALLARWRPPHYQDTPYTPIQLPSLSPTNNTASTNTHSTTAMPAHAPAAARNTTPHATTAADATATPSPFSTASGSVLPQAHTHTATAATNTTAKPPPRPTNTQSQQPPHVSTPQPQLHAPTNSQKRTLGKQNSLKRSQGYLHASNEPVPHAIIIGFHPHLGHSHEGYSSNNNTHAQQPPSKRSSLHRDTSLGLSLSPVHLSHSSEAVGTLPVPLMEVPQAFKLPNWVDNAAATATTTAAATATAATAAAAAAEGASAAWAGAAQTEREVAAEAAIAAVADEKGLRQQQPQQSKQQQQQRGNTTAFASTVHNANAANAAARPVFNVYPSSDPTSSYASAPAHGLSAVSLSPAEDSGGLLKLDAQQQQHEEQATVKQQGQQSQQQQQSQQLLPQQQQQQGQSTPTPLPPNNHHHLLPRIHKVRLWE